MGEMTDKIKGTVDETIGKAKEAIGKHTDNDKLRAEGVVQQGKGKAEKAVGKVKGALGDDV